MHSLVRLRTGHRIRGFRRSENNTFFYSRDFLWWTGIVIQHDAVDEFTQLRDKNNRPIFEWDIVSVKTHPLLRSKRFLVRKVDNEFKLCLEGETKFRSIDLLSKSKSVEVSGHLFPVDATYEDQS
ncbi:MAG: hypothetical protein RL226_1355 [Bacteroidota bacterium]